MRINRLHIPDFRNLKGLTLAPSDEMTQVVIGQNATGKSNLLEALVAIFRFLELGNDPVVDGKPVTFDFEIDWECQEQRIQAKRIGEQTTLSVTEAGESLAKVISFEHFRQRAEAYLPRQVFGYYAGRSARLKSLFYYHQSRQYKAFRRLDETLLRRLFYCRNDHAQLILLVYLIEMERAKRQGVYKPEDDQLCQYLGIEGLESALFVTRKPRRDPTEKMKEIGDERFWYAIGVSADTLDLLWSNALAPIGDDLEKVEDFRGQARKQDVRYFFLDRDRLLAFADATGDTMFIFRMLEGLVVADYLDEVRIQIHRRGMEGSPLSFTQLSEGEQQLLMVLGLIKFTSEDECLFVLDEPDTNINPIWKYNYFKMIEDFLGDDPEARRKNQLFLTTHDPLLLGTLRKEQVHVLSFDEQTRTTDVRTPRQDPLGMGFSGLLRSEMFGLRSTVDQVTLKQIDRRNELFARKKRKGKLAADDDRELTELTARLEELGFGMDFRDPTYQLFVERMALHTRFHKQQLSPEEIEEQERLADEIIDEILKRESASDG